MAVTPVQQKIRDKTITAKQWAEMVKTGNFICENTPGGDAVACGEALAERLGDGAGNVKNIEWWSFAPFYPHGWWEKYDPEEKYHLTHEGFSVGWERKLRRQYGSIDWHHWGWSMGAIDWYYRWHHEVKEKRGMDWFLASVSPPENGFFNWGYGPACHRLMQWASKKTVLEVREDYAWCLGTDTTVHIDDVDYIVECDAKKYEWPQIAETAKPSPEIEKIADNIVAYMGDGDCIQLGIGTLVGAVAQRIAQKGLRHLGIHSELFGTALMDLVESGSVDNSRRALDFGTSTWTIAFPFNTKRYYDFFHRNPRMKAVSIEYSNNIVTISQLDHMLAINNVTAIDLYGQTAASCYDTDIISGTGGQFQFTLGSPLAQGGRAMLVCTATRKDKKTGELVSRIVPSFPPGTTVDVPAQRQCFLVTEYGAVDLRGLDGGERTRAIISIAHPDFREELEKKAYEFRMIPRNFPVSMDPQKRRYPDYHKERRNWKSPYAYFNGVSYENQVIRGK